MLISLSTACLYHYPLRWTFSLAAEAGFDGVELVMGPEAWLRGADYVRQLGEEYDLRVLSIHQTLLSFYPRQPRGGRMMDATEFAVELGCPTVVVHAPGAHYWGEPHAREWLDSLLLCRERAAEGRVRLSLENSGWYHESSPFQVLGQLPVLVSFAQRHDLDLTLDTCHVGTMGDVSLCEAYGAVADLVNNIHYSDLKRMRVPLGSDFFRTLLSHHQLPGEGDLPLQGLVNQLVRDAYAGPLTFEIGAYALRAWSLARAQARLTRAVHQVRASAAASTPVWCEANPSMSLSGE